MAIEVDVVISGTTATAVYDKTTTAIITTNLQEDKLATKGGIITGPITPSDTDTIDLGSATKRFNAIYVKDAHLAGSSLHLGEAATISAGAGGGFSFDTDAETVFGDIRVRNLTVTGVQSVIESTNLVIKDNIIVVNSGEAGAGITLTSGGLVIDRGTLENATFLFNDNTDKFEFNFPISVDGSELALVPNLIATGQTLQGQITLNDGDIVTLTTNLESTGSTVAANLITSGQTLTTNLAATETTLAANLVTSGQTLTTNLASTGTTVAANLVTSGQTLTSDIASTGDTVAANLVTSGQYLTSEVGTLSGLSVFHSMTGNFATHFTDLDDIFLAGNQGKYLKVNAQGIGLAYDLPPVTGVGGEGGGATHFTGLIDTPNDYSSAGNFPENGGLLVFNSTSEQIAYISSGAFASDVDLILSGNTLDSKRDVLSGNLISSGNVLDAARDTLSGNLISTGNNLENQIISNDGDISTLTSNLISTGNTLDSQRDTLSGNLISTGNTLDSQRDTLSGNLISTGNNLETQIISNDGDISTLQTATGTLQDQKFDKMGGTLSGSVTPDASGTLNLGTRSLPFQSGYFDELWVGGNTLQIGDDASISADADGFSFATTGTTTFGAVSITGDLGVSGNFTLGDTTTDKITTRGDLYVEDDAFFGDAVKVTGSLTVDGTASAAAPTLDTHLTTKLYVDTADNTLTTNLASTGSNLQAQVTTDIANLVSTGAIVDDISGNLITSGQTLQTQITNNDSDISTLTSNLVTTGQALETTTDTISGNLITSGQTLQTQITSNDSDISSLTTNLVSTGSTLAADIVTVSGLTFGNDSDIATITSNLVSTGQTLTTEINTVSGLITSNDGDITALQAATGTLKTSVDANTTNISSNDSDITTLTTNLVSTGAVVDDISGNLISSGNFLDSEIAIVSGIAGAHTDISSLTSNLVTTGQTLQTQITANDGDITSLTTNLASTGSSLDTKIDTLSGVVTLDSETGNLIDTSMTGNFAVNFLDLDDTPSSIGAVAQSVVVNAARNALIFSGVTAGGGGSSTFLNLSDTPAGFTADRLLAVNSAGDAVEFLQSGSLVTDSETGVFATAANLISTGNNLEGQITSNDSDISTLTTNLVTTGQTLQTQLTSNDGDISSLTSNLGTTGQTLQTQITSNDSDIVTLTSNLITTGQTLTTDVATVSGLITNNDTELGDLRTATGSLQTQVISNDGDISTLTTNLISTGSIVDDVSGNLITTGQTLQTQITSNDGDITSLTSNLVTTGQTLQTQITSNDSDVSTLTTNLISTGQSVTSEIAIVSGLTTSNDTDIASLTTNLVTTGQTLQTQVTSNDSDISTLTSNLATTDSNLITTGQTLQTQITSNDSDISTLDSTTVKLTSNQTIAGNKTFSNTVTITDLNVTGTQTTINTTNLAIKDNLIEINSGEAGAGITLVSGGITINRGSAANANILFNDSTDQFELNFPIATEGNLVATATNLIATGQTLQTQITSNDGDISTLTSNLSTTDSNLVTTGQTLQTQITSNDSDISTLTTNLISTGTVVDDISGNLITTGQTLQTQITSNDSDVSTLTSNLISTGQTLTTDIGTVSGLITSNDTELSNLRTATGSLQTQVTSNDSDITLLTTNLITTGQTLQTQVTSNDSDISTLTTNLISTGQSVTSEIAIVSGLTTSNDSDIATLTTNIGTTGQTLQTQITSNDSDISTLTSNLITTGQTLQVTGHLADTTVLESFSQGLNVGTSNDLASRKLHVVGDIEISGTIYQSGSLFEGGGGGGSSTFLALTDTPGSFTANKYLSVNSAGNAVEMVDTIQSGFATIDQGYFTGLTLTGAATGIVQNATGSVAGLDLADNKWDVSVIEEFDTVGDAYYESGTLLLHLDGIDGSASTTDDSPSNHAVTFNSDAHISTDESRFGGSSVNFDGAGDSLSLPASSDWNWATNDFTIEFWLYLNSTSRQYLTGPGTNTTTHYHGIGIDYNSVSTNKLGIWASSNGTSWDIINSDGGGNGLGSTVVTQNTWHHIAYVRSGSSFKLYLDGVQEVSVTSSASVYDGSGTTWNFSRCGYNGGTFYTNGYMDEIRITKGVARYTAAFTPPTGPFKGATETDVKYIGQVGGWDDADVDYGIKKLSSTELSVKKISTDVPDRLYVNVQKLGAVGEGVAFSNTFTADGIVSGFALDSSVPQAKDLLVTINGIIQRPVVDYTLSNNTGVYFNSALTSGFNVEARHLSLGPSGATGPTGPAGSAGSAPDLTASGFALSTNLVATGAIVDDISGNLITSGQTLQTQITSNDGDITSLTSNLITTGQTLQTQITSNDGDISTLTTNLISTGQSVTSEIAIVSGLTTSNDTDITNLTTNLVTTGQTLTSEIITVSGLIPATVIDGGGTANKVPLWSDANTIGDSVISQSSSKIGIGTATPSSILELNATSPELKFRDSTTGLITLGHDGSNAAFTAHKGHLALTASEANKDIEFKAKRDITFHEVGGSEVARIEADTGKVGIGTVSPSTLFHCHGNATFNHPSSNLQVDFTANNSTILNFTNGTSEGTVFRTDEYFRFDTGGSTERVRIDSAGKVGVGTNAPGAQLHISNSTTAGLTGLLISQTHGGSGTSWGLSVDVDVNSDSDNGAKFDCIRGVAAVTILEALTNGTSRFKVQGDGKVGIGTASPGGALEIQSSVITEPVFVVNSNYAGVQAGQILFRHGRTANALSNNDSLGDIIFQGFDSAGGLQNFGSINAIAADVTAGSANGVIDFTTFVDGTSAERMRIHSNGYVGIGTAAPDYTLEVVVNEANWATQIQNDHASGYGLLLTGGKADGTTDALLVENVASTALLLVQGDGNVGIGSAAPAQKLHVVGNQKVTGYLDVGAGATLGQARISANATNLILQAQNNASIEARLTNTNLAISNNITSFILDATASSFAGFNSNSDVGTALLSTGASTRVALAPNGVEKVSVLANGKVGIGTTAPEQLLDILTATNVRHLRVQGAWDGKTSPLVEFKTIAGGNVLALQTGTAGSTIEILDVKNNAGSVFIVKGDGKVGIGTDTPERRLHIEHADTTTKAALAIENSYVSGADASVWFKTVDREWAIGIDESNSGAFTFSNNSVLGTTDRVTIQRDGNVGIGTVTPNKVFHVVGDIEISGAIYQSGSLFEGGGGGGGGSSTFAGLSDTPGSFTANKYLSVNSAGNAVEMVDAIQSGYATLDQEIFTGFDLTGSAVGIVQNASGSLTSLDLADNKWDVSIIEETDSQVVTGDANWSDTKLLLPLDGVDAATSTSDASDIGNTVSFNGTAQIDTAQKKFGSSSLLLDGDSDWIEVPDSSNLDFANSDFTVEGWFRFSSLGNNTFFSSFANGTAASRQFYLTRFSSSNQFRLGYQFEGGANADTYYSWSSAAINTWYHIALERHGTTIKVYIDGTSVISVAASTNSLQTGEDPFRIGVFNDSTTGSPAMVWHFAGWVDDVRVTKGSARYQGNFTPPSAAFYTNASVNITETKYISQIGGWDDTDVDYGIKKISNSELSVKKMGADDAQRPIDRLYVNVEKLGSLGQGIAFDQVYTGDGVTTNYLLTDDVPSARDVLVSVQGLVQTPTIDYTLAGTTGVSFTTGVTSGDEISLRYLALGPSGAAGVGSFAKDVFTGNGVVSGFTMGRSVSNILETTVFVNGLAQFPDDNYFTDGTSLTFASGDIASGDLIMVRHTY